MEGDIDRVLVRRLLARDEQAFSEFFDDYYPRLCRFARLRLPDDDAAHEASQATMVHAVRTLAQWRGEASLFTWLCTICRNEITAVARKAARRPVVPLLTDDPGVRATLESLAAHADRPDADLDRADVARVVQLALDHLPPRYSRVLTWKYVDDMSVRDIADRLTITPKAAESLLTRARDSFREAFRTLHTRPTES